MTTIKPIPPFLRLFVLLLASMLLAAPLRAQQATIVNSPHDLSANSSSKIRASSEQEICIFCHTPHNASPIQPLWNRNMPVSAYTVYSSNSLQAKPGQPTGSSKLCLSCHDGTIALGLVLSRSAPISMVGGVSTLPPGPTNLGTSLADDHPISFKYDTNLATLNPKLKSPLTLPTGIRMDSRGEMQCTSCHNAHNNAFGKFLVMDNSASQLCNACHQPGTTTINAHVACNSCHMPHNSPSGPYLLTGKTVTDSCLTCHSGATGANQGPNVAPNSAISLHDTRSAVNLTNHLPNNLVCNDCHEGHTMQNATALAPTLSPMMGKVSGVNASGAAVALAKYEYEVCFKCHADSQATLNLPIRITRKITQTNTRMEFASSSVSYHPVEAAGKGADVPSLKPGWTTSSLMYCTDCHASSASKDAGGSGANGPHNSAVSPLLIAGYTTIDGSAENTAAYALCYRCHDRTKILSETIAAFKYHRKHIIEYKTPCSVCHDSHGISSTQGNSTNNAHLINFNTSVVSVDPVTKRLEYRSNGRRTGQCYLSCHGAAHSPRSY